MNKLSLLALSAAALTFSTAANARTFAEIYTDCGLGAMIAPNNDAVAAVTNVTWDWGTTAISSNVSSPDSCAGGQESTASFIFQSYDAIAANLATGEGKHLAALLEIAGYATEDQAQAAEFLRQDFAQAVSEESYSSLTHYQKVEQLYGLVYGSNV